MRDVSGGAAWVAALALATSGCLLDWPTLGPSDGGGDGGGAVDGGGGDAGVDGGPSGCVNDPCTGELLCVVDPFAPGGYRCEDCAVASCPATQVCVQLEAGGVGCRAGCVPAPGNLVDQPNPTPRVAPEGDYTNTRLCAAVLGPVRDGSSRPSLSWVNVRCDRSCTTPAACRYSAEPGAYEEVTYCDVPGGEVSCTDTLDADLDGRTDCADYDCIQDPACAWSELDGSATHLSISGNTEPVREFPVGMGLGTADDLLMMWASSNPGSSMLVGYERDPGGWTQVGSSAFEPTAGGPSEYPSLVLDSALRATVAWQESAVAGEPRIFLKAKAAGGGWSGIDGSDTGDGLGPAATNVFDPEVVLDSVERPIVVWHDGTNLHGRLFVDPSWTRLGDTDGNLTGDLTAASRDRPSVAVGGNSVFLAWNQDGYIVGVRGLLNPDATPIPLGNGSDQPPGIGGGESVGHLDLAASAADSLWVVWAEGPVDARAIYARHWNGTGWENSELVSDGIVGHAAAPTVAIDSTGEPVVAWEHAVDGAIPNVFLRRRRGNTWEGLGLSDAPGGLSRIWLGDGSFFPVVGIAGDRICVAWSYRGGLSGQSGAAYLRCIDPAP